MHPRQTPTLSPIRSAWPSEFADVTCVSVAAAAGVCTKAGRLRCWAPSLVDEQTAGAVD